MGSIGNKNSSGDHRDYLNQGNFSNLDEYDEQTVNDNALERSSSDSGFSINMNSVRSLVASVRTESHAAQVIKEIDEQLKRNPTPAQKKELEEMKKRLKKGDY